MKEPIAVACHSVGKTAMQLAVLRSLQKELELKTAANLEAEELTREEYNGRLHNLTGDQLHAEASGIAQDASGNYINRAGRRVPYLESVRKSAFHKAMSRTHLSNSERERQRL